MSRLELVRINGVNDSEPEKAMQHVTRRAVLAGSVSAAALPLLSAKAASPPAGEQTPGIYRYRIGTFELTALYDGIWYRPITEKFIRNAPFAEVENALAAAFMPADKLATPFTTLIVNTGQKLVLIDTGTGGQIAPSAGVLRANLVAAGIDPQAIDLIVISHFHPDHINGIKDKDNDLVFPNAEIMVPEAEWKYWMDDANLNAAPADLKLTFRNQRRIFSDIAPHVTRFEPGAEVASGITTLAAPGHTPGHTVFAIHSGDQSLLVLGDTAQHPGRVRAPSRLAGGFRHRRRGGRRHPQEAVRSRRRGPHAGDRLSLPLPGLRPPDQDRASATSMFRSNGSRTSENRSSRFIPAPRLFYR